jgi:tRNA(Arg) A34 adenosine deaminase TadA
MVFMKRNYYQQYMLAAIKHVKSHICDNDGGPFGACITQGDKIISLGHNTVLRDTDPTAHAEINAIQTAAQRLNRIDLSDCTIYSTTEPCPMCFSAIHWARIGQIVYGTNIEDVKKLGFHELSISNQKMKQFGNSPVKIVGEIEKEACNDLLLYWQQHSKQQTY